MLAWSYSALNTYETCPKKFYEEKIAKSVVISPNAIRDYGLEAHKAFELRLGQGKPLPMDLQHHEKILSTIADKKGTGVAEQKMALNRDLEPTGYFDKDVWVRAVADYIKHNGKTAIVFDWKFGKMKGDFEQLDLLTAVFLAYKPAIKNVRGVFYWAKEKKLTSKDYTREEQGDIWDAFIPRVQRLQKAKASNDFPARQNFLCKKWCPVTQCEFNGI